MIVLADPVLVRAQMDANNILHRAIREGRMGRPERCEACGRGPYLTPGGYPGLIWHHHDYALPTDVIGLCGSCHTRVHQGRVVEPRTGRTYQQPPGSHRFLKVSAPLSVRARQSA